MRKTFKNLDIHVLFVLILVSCASHCLAEEIDSTPSERAKWEAGALSAQRLRQSMHDSAKFLEKYIKDDEQALEAHINRLKNALKANSNTLEGLRKELDAKQGLHEELELRFQEASSDMKTLEGTVRTAARQCVEQLKSSPVTATLNNRLRPLEIFLSGKSFPSIGDISAISRILFEEIAQTGVATCVQGDFIGLSGTEQSGTIVQAGGFFLGFHDGKNGGFLTPVDPLPIGKQGLPLTFSKKITAWLKGDMATLCMDITRGAALEAQASKRSFTQWFEAGGLLLWPILAIAVAGLFVSLYKVCYLFTRRRLSKDTFSKIEQYMKEYEWNRIKELLSRLQRIPAARVLSSGIRFYNTGLDALDNGLQEARLNVLSRLERMLPLLNVFAAMAPLLGLLGTVTGMITTFQTITTFGTGDPRILSTGISEALITTQAGLGITIPFMLIHHLLKRRVNFFLDDIEEASARFAALIAEYQHSQKGMVKP
ncbi:MAG: MotA/TolQ/ExbB proton channel family protein [Desulfatiglandales bacterium]